MSFFSILKMPSIVSAVMVVTVASTAPVHANDFSSITGASVGYSDEQCLRSYRTMRPGKLIDHGCFNKQRPFARCYKLIPNWANLRKLESEMCLKVFSDLTLNTNAPEYQFTSTHSFQKWREDYAYNLVLNEKYMKALDELERFELKALADNAKSRF